MCMIFRLSAISYQLSAISYQLSAISYQLSAISYQLSAISYQLSAISYRGAVRVMCTTTGRAMPASLAGSVITKVVVAFGVTEVSNTQVSS